MNNKESVYLCHALSGEAKKVYNRKYYKKNKQYWVDFAKRKQSAKVSDSDGYDRYALGSSARPKISNSLPKVPSGYSKSQLAELKEARRLEAQEKALDEIRYRQRKALIDASVSESYRHASKMKSRKTPRVMVDTVELKELRDAKHRSAMEKAARNVHSLINSAVNSFKTSWQIGAADIIKAGRDIKKGWNSV